MRGATHSPVARILLDIISIHAPHARSDLTLGVFTESLDISIHAPHARSDVCRLAVIEGQVISIHAPHARSDDGLTRIRKPSHLFQSTLLMRGATRAVYRCRRCQRISIHAPHARSDAVAGLPSCIIRQFQSTLLMRGATSTSSRPANMI